ncbi:hypothetical protein KVR01_000336 [Diaporthe batatas]|uniref:uncharacterized protein n=1 Tax=Diaporthe batatas TaxID=748121 RepID=UPI001D0533A0|nr:uncharacterized protein KVR01_000336 [Diaporthe batatas]KAG8169591.1 hypothetical protein KVR01_000336 [Diaporthe batatas]
MKSFAIIATVLAAAAAAGPIGKRAVFTDTTFNDISISGGTAGNAQAEAEQALSGLPTDLTQVEQADLDFLNSVNQVANDAEKEAFNPAIEAATGAEADSLQIGKIKNKVLKLTATIKKLEAQQAQGEDVADKLAEEQKKLNNNIAQDEAEAGNASTNVQFDGTISAN